MREMIPYSSGPSRSDTQPEICLSSSIFHQTCLVYRGRKLEPRIIGPRPLSGLGDKPYVSNQVRVTLVQGLGAKCRAFPVCFFKFQLSALRSREVSRLESGISRTSKSGSRKLQTPTPLLELKGPCMMIITHDHHHHDDGRA